MGKKISIQLNTRSIDAAIKTLQEYQQSLDRQRDELCRRLAQMGAVSVSLGYSRAVYSGEKDITVSVEPIENGYAILAEGESVLFVEFGAGVTYGYGHPQAGELGMGPGSYPDGKGHWDNPNGWWIPKEAGGGHTYGNPPSMTMYQTAKELQEAVLRMAKEVFASD